MGNGHNAHQNTRGMAVPFNSRRPVLTQSVGLVDVSVHYQGHRAQRTANGCLDQGGHYTIYDWQALLKSNSNLKVLFGDKIEPNVPESS